MSSFKIPSYEIIICDKCNGKGYMSREIVKDYHKGEYEYDLETCFRCQGSGRLEKITTINPYAPIKKD